MRKFYKIIHVAYILKSCEFTFHTRCPFFARYLVWLYNSGEKMRITLLLLIVPFIVMHWQEKTNKRGYFAFLRMVD